MPYPFHLTPESSASLLAESEAHRAYLAQLREQRDRRGAPTLQFADTTMQGVLDDAEERGDARRFSGDALTGFGDIDDRDYDTRAADKAYDFREMQDADRRMGEGA